MVQDFNIEDNSQQPIDYNRLQSLLDMANKRSEYNKPYIKEMENYVDNYNALNKQAMNRDRFYSALAGLSGNNAYMGMVGKYNPVDIEANRLALTKQLSDAKLSEDISKENLIGNAYLLRQAGMPIEAALADPALLKSLSPVMSSMNALTGKKYTADIGLQKAKIYSQAKEKVAQMNNARAMAIAKGTWSTQKEIAYHRDKKNIERAIVQSLGFGVNPAQLLGATNALGYTELTDEQLKTLGNLIGGDID